MDSYSHLRAQIQSKLDQHRASKQDFDQIVYWYGAACLQTHCLELALRQLLQFTAAADPKENSSLRRRTGSRMGRWTLGQLVREVKRLKLFDAAFRARLASANRARQKLVHGFYIEKMLAILAGPAEWKAIEGECRQLVVEIRLLLNELEIASGTAMASVPLSAQDLSEVLISMGILTDVQTNSPSSK